MDTEAPAKGEKVDRIDGSGLIKNSVHVQRSTFTHFKCAHCVCVSIDSWRFNSSTLELITWAYV